MASQSSGVGKNHMAKMNTFLRSQVFVLRLVQRE